MRGFLSGEYSDHGLHCQLSLSAAIRDKDRGRNLQIAGIPHLRPARVFTKYRKKKTVFSICRRRQSPHSSRSPHNEPARTPRPACRVSGDYERKHGMRVCAGAGPGFSPKRCRGQGRVMEAPWPAANSGLQMRGSGRDGEKCDSRLRRHFTHSSQLPRTIHPVAAPHAAPCMKRRPPT